MQNTLLKLKKTRAESLLKVKQKFEGRILPNIIPWTPTAIM